MNKELTEIVLVVDRSGSMYSCKDDAEGGINTFIKEQKELDCKANLTIVQFDDSYDFVCEGIDINTAEDFSLIPRGCTALLDATGRAITETGERLAKMKEKDRPGLVAFVIVTDGQENASKEFQLDQVKELIEQQTDQYKWQFTFLGAGPDAFAGGAQMGFKGAAMASYDGINTHVAYTCASASISRMRSATLDGTEIKNEYTDEERLSMTEK
ncbi:MAG: VWA domain-containing protein [Dehalococcoidia bacterium]|nr:MAG: VWA domain-containing protein [Dehalococcoidia bacterium]